MISKRLFIFTAIVITILAVVMGMMLADAWQGKDILSPKGTIQNASINSSYTLTWELGDEIIPFPFVDGKWLDCDDAALYSYLWLDSFPELKVQPMYGILNWWENDTWIRRAHVWLVVSDNQSAMIYDYGVALPSDFYRGRRISYAQLLMYAHADY